ncbi:MAG: MBL fold metallo-hydrolase [Verrucomicrobiota bacterium]
MKTTFYVALCCCVLALPLCAKPTPTRDSNEKKQKENPPAKTAEMPVATNGVQCQWFGHSFIYLTSQSGVRVAMDPFSEEISLPFPKQLHADVVLISYEGLDRSGGERLFGAPQIFRSVTGIGANRASGVLFRGIETYRDSSRGKNLGRNTVYVFELDNLRFCHLGGIGYPLSRQNVDDIGRVDVLFLPVGNQILSVDELREMASHLEAKWIVPITYYSETGGFKDLRRIEEFLEDCKLKAGIPIKQIDANDFIFRVKEMPDQPTILLLQKP